MKLNYRIETQRILHVQVPQELETELSEEIITGPLTHIACCDDAKNGVTVGYDALIEYMDTNRNKLKGELLEFFNSAFDLAIKTSPHEIFFHL